MVMIRTRDAALIGLATAEIVPDFNVEEWVGDERNVALEDDGNLAMFHYSGLASYQAHWYMARTGKAALATAVEALRVMFGRYGAEGIWGWTPRDRPEAIAFNRRLGAMRAGGWEKEDGVSYDLFVGTKQAFEAKYGPVRI